MESQTEDIVNTSRSAKKRGINLLSFSLLSGLLLSSVGIALTVLLIIIEGASYGLLGGIIPLSVGIGLLTHYAIKRGEKRNG